MTLQRLLYYRPLKHPTRITTQMKIARVGFAGVSDPCGDGVWTWKWTIDGWERERRRTTEALRSVFRPSGCVTQSKERTTAHTDFWREKRLLWRLVTSKCMQKEFLVSSEDDWLLNHRKIAWIIISLWKRKRWTPRNKGISTLWSFYIFWDMRSR